MPYELAQDKTYDKTCATSEDSDQPVQTDQSIHWSHVLSTVSPKRNKQEPLPYYVDVQAGLSLCWSHRSYCRVCHALTRILLTHGRFEMLYLP